ncbi:16S rRNA (uracil(1498)-N(3))-methyltransferase [soil metagenome]
MPPRIYFDSPLAHVHQAGIAVPLPSGAARHVQVLRLQPGAALTLFDGLGGEWSATVTRMGRSDVDVMLGTHDAVQRELPLAVTLALGMPANDRMDALVEKATELGAAGFVPLICERSVLRLSGERADRKVEHWEGVARAACEQSGRTAVPSVAAVQGLLPWLRTVGSSTRSGVVGVDETTGSPPRGAEQGEVADAGRATTVRWLLSLREAKPIGERLAESAAVLTAPSASLCVLSGPEGGFTEAEEAAARERGFQPVSLGPRVLRSDTAPLAVLSHVGLWLASQS